MTKVLPKFFSFDIALIGYNLITNLYSICLENVRINLMFFRIRICNKINLCLFDRKMKSKFYQLAHQAKLKSKTEQHLNNKRNHLNESYQQYEFLNMKGSFERLIANLQHLAQQENVDSRLFTKVLQTPQKYCSSLLSVCLNIVQLIDKHTKIRISHQHNSSQAIFLVLFLKFCNPQKFVTVLTTKLNFKHWSKFVIESKCLDPESELKKLLAEVKVNIVFIEDFNKQTKLDKNQIIVLDLMNCQVVDYRPALLILKSKLSASQKLIVYHSHFQEHQIEKTLDQIYLQLLLTEVSQVYPIEVEYVQNNTQVKQKLVEFLKEDESHPQKQDIVIFYKNQHHSTSTAKKFIHKIRKTLSHKNLQSHVQFITAKNQILLSAKNHIFLVENANQLLQWNYPYEDVFLVFDFGWNATYRFDHKINCFTQTLKKNDLREKTRRLSFLGINKVGRYICTEEQVSDQQDYLQRPIQIMSYVLKMIDFQFSDLLQTTNQRVKYCLQTLQWNQIVTKQNQNDRFTIRDQKIYKFTQLGIDPIQAQLVLKVIQKEKEKEFKILSNIVLMAICLVNTRGNLRQAKQIKNQKLTLKPTGVWRKNGYLDSCLEILTKAQIIEKGMNIKKSISKRKTSKIEESQTDPFGFGDLFDPKPLKKIQFEDMQMDDLIRQYFVNDIIFAELREKIDELRDIFEVEQTIIKFDQSMLHELIQILAERVPNSIAIFSGNRRLGYILKGQDEKIFPNRDSLIAQLNQFPQFIIILRIIQQEDKKQIYMCNNVHVDSFMSVFSQLPSHKNDSLAQHQIEFHGISSSIFKGLFRKNGIQMRKFEDEHQCYIEPNEQMATITVYCKKQLAQKIKDLFGQMIGKIKDRFINYNKIIHFLGSTNISMSNGGQIKQIIKDNYINKCYLNNLDLLVTQEDLEDLFQEFFVLKNIQILAPENGKYSKSAIIEFNSQKDYYRFYSYYNECKYFDRLLEVKPIIMEKKNSIQPQIFIDFKWYVWKSHQKAIVMFKDIQSAEKAFKNLQQNPLIDASPIKFSIDKKKIYLQKLGNAVDQIFLQKAFSVYGSIEEVEILKTPLKQPAGQQTLLDYLLRDSLQIARNIAIDDQYKIHPIEKLKNGLRKCRVKVKNQETLRMLVGSLNGLKNKIGQGRLYAETMFTKPLLVAYASALHLYEQILQELTHSPLKPNFRYTFQDYGNHRNYIILSSPLNDTLKLIALEIQKKLVPKPVKLSSLEKDIILSDVGLDNLMDLEEKFNCKLISNSMKKTLQVICQEKNFDKIQTEITLRVKDNFFYRISLNNRSYKNLSENKEKLEEIKKKYFLSLLEIEEYSKTLIFQGNANHVQNALNYMMHLIQSFSKSEDELINTQVCLICYQEPSRPYRLQNCGHKFCFNCLDQCINSTLGDISMFPIKCPHCMIEVTIDDLQSLIEKNSWQKLINMAVNQFVNRNSQIMTFCYTAGCKQINMLKLSNFKCDVCAISYCCQCKQPWHEGLTCEEARIGTDALFKKYMLENGVRVCPNTSCKMPIIRSDGCFRVTCSRCNKSMCFKCEPDKMKAYDDYNQCYKHLNDVHGGYW